LQSRMREQEKKKKGQYRFGNSPPGREVGCKETAHRTIEELAGRGRKRTPLHIRQEKREAKKPIAQHDASAKEGKVRLGKLILLGRVKRCENPRRMVLKRARKRKKKKKEKKNENRVRGSK